MKAKRRHPLSKKDAKKLVKTVQERLPGLISDYDVIELVDYGDFKVYVVDGVPCLAEAKGKLIPLLKCLLKKGTGSIPRVYVDPGATKALGRGADLMVPGIRRFEGEWEPGVIVVAVDERYNAPVAVLEALISSRELDERLKGERRGKAFKNLHRPGDDLWEAS